eukprot:437147_1
MLLQIIWIILTNDIAQIAYGTYVYRQIENHGCGTTAYNLGTAFTTPTECAKAAIFREECTGDQIMWSDSYGYSLGCRCCSKNTTLGSYNENWDIYKYIPSYFAFNVFIPGTQAISINDVKISNYNNPYNFTVIFDSNTFTFNATLNVLLQNTQNTQNIKTVKQCQICYIDCTECGQRNEGIISKIFTVTTSVQIISTDNSEEFWIFPSHSTPITLTPYINFAGSSTTISPGNSIPIIFESFAVTGTYTINVESNNQKSFILVDQLNITVSNKNITKCEICNSFPCIDCKEGVIPWIDSRFIDQTSSYFNMTFKFVSSENITIYPLSGVQIAIALCSRGYGIPDVSICAKCQQCSYDEFMLIESIKPCYSCQQTKMNYLNGVQCKGADNIFISYNYWISALSNTNELYPLISFSENDMIFAAYCPSGFCCGSMGGCNYIKSYDNYYNNITNTDQMLCSFGRDPSSILCGKCEEGKSELFGSANCGMCNKTNYGLIALIIFIIFLPLTIYIVYFESKPTEKGVSQNKILQQILMLNSLFLDVIFYFYQALSAILSCKGYAVSTFTVSLFSVFN